MAIDPNNLAATAKLTFADEFNGLSIWNGSSGTWSTNWWYKDEWGLYSTSNGSTLDGNGELEWYINDNFQATSAVNPWTVSGGLLTLTADRASASISPLINNYKYTSGMLNTWHSFSQEYGYFEISAKLPAGQGLWPAFWLLQQDGDWPPEIDVMEFLGNDTSKYYASVHTSATGSHTSQTDAVNTSNLTTAFHRYGVDWEKDNITFYLDGAKVGQMATPADMHEPMYMIVNLAVGGYWPGSPNASTVFPAKMQVDYIRAYTDIGAATGGTTSGGTTTGGTSTGGTTTGGTTNPSAGRPELQGTAAPDHIIGQAASEYINGQDGDDYLRGGDGDDYVVGGAGNDDLHGNAGQDTVQGGAGDDWVVGGQGNDYLLGDRGVDIVLGNLGNDTAEGGDDADTVRGGQGDDVLRGGAGADWLSGDKGSDTIYGGTGADIFHTSGDAGIDRIMDFSRAEGDRIMIDMGSTWSAHQAGADTVVDINGGAAQVILVGTSLSTLHGDWIFAG